MGAILTAVQRQQAPAHSLDLGSDAEAKPLHRSSLLQVNNRYQPYNRSEGLDCVVMPHGTSFVDASRFGEQCKNFGRNSAWVPCFSWRHHQPWHLVPTIRKAGSWGPGGDWAAIQRQRASNFSLTTMRETDSPTSRCGQCNAGVPPVLHTATDRAQKSRFRRLASKCSSTRLRSSVFAGLGVADQRCPWRPRLTCI